MNVVVDALKFEIWALKSYSLFATHLLIYQPPQSNKEQMLQTSTQIPSCLYVGKSIRLAKPKQFDISITEYTSLY